jgi:hypothetical protein
LVRLRENITELSINKLANTIGADGFSRCPRLPFWTTTGRNQPSAEGKVYLPSLPTWLHGLLRPPLGWTLVGLDWDCQEVAIMAALSGDGAMIADYCAGDPHWSFGQRAGLVAPGMRREDNEELRHKTFKPVVLGQMYGMTPHGIEAKTGKSLLWARDVHARHRQVYSTFHRWLGDVVAQARFDRTIVSPFGWPRAVIGDTGTYTLMNFMAQAGGADAMRITSIAAMEAGIKVCASVHDAFWILAPDDNVDSIVERMRDIMMQAGTAVTGGLPIAVSVAAVVRGRNFGACRKPGAKGHAMWAEVQELLSGGLRQQASA